MMYARSSAALLVRAHQLIYRRCCQHNPRLCRSPAANEMKDIRRDTIGVTVEYEEHHSQGKPTVVVADTTRRSKQETLPVQVPPSYGLAHVVSQPFSHVYKALS